VMDDQRDLARGGVVRIARPALGREGDVGLGNEALLARARVTWKSSGTRSTCSS
jgi:hypothetical protein